MALRITEFVKDKIFRVIYYIPLIGRITQNYCEEQEAKINYYRTLYLVKICYRRVIECVKNSDAEHVTICAGFAKSFAEEFAKIAAAIPKDDKKFAEKVDLDVEGAWALATAAQEAVDKMKEGNKINYCSTIYAVKLCYRRVIEHVEKSDAERATICARLAESLAEQLAKIAAAIPKDDKKFTEKVDFDVEGAWALATAAQEAVDKMKKEK